MKTSKPAKSKAKASGDEDARFLETAKKRAERAFDADKENRDLAYEDLRNFIGEGHWDPADLANRRAAGRPTMVINRLGQFVRQVTGDIRQSQTAMRAYGVDDGTDKKSAEVVSDLLRYIETRSDASDAYNKAMDSCAKCGIGHWRVITEASDDEANVQDIRITSVDDQVGILWDPDATHPNKADARFCFVPVDMTKDVFKERYPNAKASAFPNMDAYRASLSEPSSYWTGGETIRVAEYFVREDEEEADEKPGTEDDGDSADEIEDSDEGEDDASEAPEKAKKSTVPKVYRYLITGDEILEDMKLVPGLYIPIICIPGEETRIGNRTYRNGLIRFLMDPQRRYNFFASAQAELAQLQPKAPWLVTNTNVKDAVDIWQRANQDNLPFLPYEPDAKNGGAAPQRINPPVGSPAFNANLQLASEDMQAVVGIYNASLGARSNETSGVAIARRDSQGDTGTAVYHDNFKRAIKHTGRVIVGMIPLIYDTARTLRIIGEDGAVNEIKINQAVMDEKTNHLIENDVTIGKYDVMVEAGPSFTTKREEAKEAMLALVQANPNLFPIVGDLIVKAFDFPMAGKMAERLRMALPPEIRQKEEAEEGEASGKPPMQQQPQMPPPQVLMQQQELQAKAQAEQMKLSADIRMKELSVERETLVLEREKVALRIAELNAMAKTQPEAQAEAPHPNDHLAEFAQEQMKARAGEEMKLEYEIQRRLLDKLLSGTTEQDDTSEVEAEASGIHDMLAQQGEALREGLQQMSQSVAMLASAQAAPKRVIRDDMNRVVGIDTGGFADGA